MAFATCKFAWSLLRSTLRFLVGGLLAGVPPLAPLRFAGKIVIHGAAACSAGCGRIRARLQPAALLAGSLALSRDSVQ